VEAKVGGKGELKSGWTGGATALCGKKKGIRTNVEYKTGETSAALTRRGNLLRGESKAVGGNVQTLWDALAELGGTDVEVRHLTGSNLRRKKNERGEGNRKGDGNFSQ